MTDNQSNNNSTTSTTPAQSTDWAAVRAYYLTCRSYKQTAEHFGISPDSVRTRARRGGWSVQNEHPMNTPGVRNDLSGCSNEHPMNTPSVQKAPSA